MGVDSASVIDYFEKCLALHGDDARGVDYNGQQSQYLRFEVLSQVADLTGASVLDVGCGLGHFHDFLVLRGIQPRHYRGVDISPAMIAAAKQARPNLDLEVEDILTTRGRQCYDYVICCGVFHLKAKNNDNDWGEFCKAMIARMYELASQGVAFNMMTDYVDYRVERLYYANPLEIFDYCRKLTRRLQLRHDYPLYEFSIYMYR
ncbi:MAG: class I SAM-dependent methyltransferase [Acidobacteriota bacterium]|nr:class I SAM-dependent methyltransferase [Blastocatellia bacterium]MDW8411962.1 class I SAM-dependent methyltransferase [Acidobacteriota bacterium]